MLAYNVGADVIERALATVSNECYSGNLVFKRGPESSGRAQRFTITVRDSSGPGAKYNQVSGRRVAAACWHAHGRLFDEILRLAPDARITTGYGGKDGAVITSEGGNWQDFPATGPFYGPMYASEMCHCH